MGFSVQNKAVFGQKADNFLENIVETLQIRSFFVGNLNYTVNVSKYSGQKSTSSHDFSSKGFFESSVAPEAIQDASNKVKEMENSIMKLVESEKERKAQITELERIVEEKNMKLKEL